VFLLVSLSAVSLGADEVRLSNGDCLTGRTLALTDGTLTFITASGTPR
jgi:hypothetical protein